MRHARRPPPKKPTVRRRQRLRWFSRVCFILAALAFGYWGWDTFGTTHLARTQMAADKAAFIQTLPPANTAIGKPYSDLNRHPPPQVSLDHLAPGAGFALLHAPTLGIEPILIRQGTADPTALQALVHSGGAIHYPSTQPPGAIGNFALSAKRRGYGDTFRRIPDLNIGDTILIETADAWYTYTIIATQIVEPAEVWVINPNPFTPLNPNGTQTTDRRLITLQTSSGQTGSQWRATHRHITWGELTSWTRRER